MRPSDRHPRARSRPSRSRRRTAGSAQPARCAARAISTTRASHRGRGSLAFKRDPISELIQMDPAARGSDRADLAAGAFARRSGRRRRRCRRPRRDSSVATSGHSRTPRERRVADRSRRADRAGDEPARRVATADGPPVRGQAAETGNDSARRSGQRRSVATPSLAGDVRGLLLPARGSQSRAPCIADRGRLVAAAIGFYCVYQKPARQNAASSARRRARRTEAAQRHDAGESTARPDGARSG